MSLNHLTEVQKGLDLKLKIGCEELSVDQFRAPESNYAIIEYRSALGSPITFSAYSDPPTNLRIPFTPQTIDTNDPDRFDPLLANGILVKKDAIYNVEVSVICVKQSTDSVMYVVKDPQYLNEANSQSQFMLADTINHITYSYTSRIEDSIIVAPLVLSVDTPNVYEITGFRVEIRYVSEI